MKESIHPQYIECTVTCACGNSFTTCSTKPAIRVEICSQCHPFYTGKQKIIDTEGRVDRFRRKLQRAEAFKAEHDQKTEAPTP